jgi:hypothetical protein
LCRQISAGPVPGHPFRADDPSSAIHQGRDGTRHIGMSSNHADVWCMEKYQHDVPAGNRAGSATDLSSVIPSRPPCGPSPG